MEDAPEPVYQDLKMLVYFEIWTMEEKKISYLSLLLVLYLLF